MYSFDQGGMTPLYAAADNGHVGALRELIAGGANINQADNVSHDHVYLEQFFGDSINLYELMH